MQLSTRLDLIEAIRKDQLATLNESINRQTHDAIEATLDDLSRGLDLSDPDDRAIFRQRFNDQVNLRSQDAVEALVRFASNNKYNQSHFDAARRVADGYINERLDRGTGAAL